MKTPQNEPPSGLPLAPCSASSEPLHVFEWLELPPANDAEKDAKEWLDKFLRPAWSKMTEGIEDWLALYRVTAEWKGERYTCSGASSMGDVWLKTEGSVNYYDHRVNVEELTNWQRILLPK
jgi:hypothetical protein